MKTCPYCAEDIKAAAILCRFCGSSLEPEEPGNPRKQHKFVGGKCVHCSTSEDHFREFGNKCVLDMARIDPGAAKIKCPKCASDKITAQKEGFGLGKAIVGGAALGGAGLLAGFVGGKKIRVTCLRCGHAWKAGGR